MAINKRPFDRRVVDRYLEKGLIKDSDYASFLKNLPDDAEKAEWVQMDLHDAEMTEEGTDGVSDDEDEASEEGA